MKNWQKLQGGSLSWDAFHVREVVIDTIRTYFKDRGFHEVETPLLVPVPSCEQHLDPFETRLQIAGEIEGEVGGEIGSETESEIGGESVYKQLRQHRAFLTTSPEYAMKKLLAAGSGNIFQICKCFRNSEGRSTHHNSEFTILEWYRTTTDYMDVLKDFEGLIGEIGAKVGRSSFPPVANTHSTDEQYLHTTTDSDSNHKQHFHPPHNSNFTPEQNLTPHSNNKQNPPLNTLIYQKKTYNLTPPWEKISVVEVFRRFVGIEVETLVSKEKLLEVGRQKEYTITPQTTWEEVFHQLLLNEIEPHLGQVKPTVLYDYPIQLCPLCKPSDTDSRFGQRFEVYVAGMEVGNAFGELTDVAQVEKHCREDVVARKLMRKTELGLDQDFIDALESGLPPSAGIAVGVDRLVMLFADVATIQQTLLFPMGELWGQENEV